MSKAELIAIDGPVAAGKSSVGSILAQKLGYSFFDTGNMYRAFTWKAIKSGISASHKSKLQQLANATRFHFIPLQGGCLSLLIDGEDVSDKLSCPEVEKQVSLVSRIGEVRQAMVLEQRKLAKRGKMVMAGRDIGTVVLPWAELKIFLTASAEERAQRRYLELLSRREEVDYDTILNELRKRDQVDSHRNVSPLKSAADAIIIDTDKVSLEQVIDKIYALAINR